MTITSTITTDGRKIMLDRHYNEVPTRLQVSQFKVGTGTTGAEESDTDLETPVPITQTLVDDCETADWTDSADMTTTLNSTTYKVGSNSLNLTKDAGTEAGVNTYKSTTSRDFTSKEFSMWLYIKDAAALAKLISSDCFVIRFGSDDSNYYEWTKDNADLTAGQWNLIDGLTSATSTETGAPTIGACDYTYISLISTGAAITWSAGDFMMDDLKVIGSSDYIKAFETGYPSLDFTNIQSTIRGRVATTDSNGYALSEVGIFNEDGSPLMESRDTFNPFSKSEEDELIVIVKNNITTATP